MYDNFSVDWCSVYFKSWKLLCKKYKPTKILEIGSFEGKSTKFWAELPNTEHITCIDTWEGSIEHSDLDIHDIEKRFDQNHGWRQNLSKLKGKSFDILCSIQSTHRQFYDLIYIDGSHDPKDVLSDAILSFNLLKSGGIMIFDDYLWINRMRFGPWHGELPVQILPHPKIAIDAFCNIYEGNIRIISVDYQLVLEKL